MKRKIIALLFATVFLLETIGCSSNQKNTSEVSKSESQTFDSDTEAETEALSFDESEPTEAAYIHIEETGETLESRINVPQGYTRTKVKEDSLAAFLRKYPMKEAGSPVLLYDGTPKAIQSDHVAVFKLPIENYDLQQCADSIMRVYAEYYWSTGQYDKIGFHFSGDFVAEYSKWREGYRISINGDNCSWKKSAAYDDSYDNFVKYMKIVFSYAGTFSMEGETRKTSLSQIKAGDVFLKGGSPGHVVMVVDVCENAEGKKAFLLAQGYMPAQEFHVLKNDLHEENPWYFEEEVKYPFHTPEYTFEEGSLKSLTY